jgi:hypothetical protein
MKTEERERNVVVKQRKEKTEEKEMDGVWNTGICITGII